MEYFIGFGVGFVVGFIFSIATDFDWSKYFRKNIEVGSSIYHYSSMGPLESFEIDDNINLYRVINKGKNKVQLELIHGQDSYKTRIVFIKDFHDYYHLTDKLPKKFEFDKDLSELIKPG